MKEINCLKKILKHLGFKVLKVNDGPRSGPDMWLIRNNDRPYTLEIKHSKKKKNNSYQVPPVELKRRQDDLIAINISDKYWLIEPMADHLKCCTKSGWRSISKLYGRGH